MDESAETFAGNARKKAAELARALDRWVLADDSGLAVDALQGAPACSRLAMPASPAMTRRTTASWWRRSPRWPTTAAAPRSAAHWPWPILRARSGLKPKAPAGADHPRAAGTAGFGYDPLFLIPEYHKTFGELSPLVKHQLSHRSRAFAHLRPGLERLIDEVLSGGS